MGTFRIAEQADKRGDGQQQVHGKQPQQHPSSLRRTIPRLARGDGTRCHVLGGAIGRLARSAAERLSVEVVGIPNPAQDAPILGGEVPAMNRSTARRLAIGVARRAPSSHRGAHGRDRRVVASFLAFGAERAREAIACTVGKRCALLAPATGGLPSPPLWHHHQRPKSKHGDR